MITWYRSYAHIPRLYAEYGLPWSACCDLTKQMTWFNWRRTDICGVYGLPWYTFYYFKTIIHQQVWTYEYKYGVPPRLVCGTSLTVRRQLWRPASPRLRDTTDGAKTSMASRLASPVGRHWRHDDNYGVPPRLACGRLLTVRRQLLYGDPASSRPAYISTQSVSCVSIRFIFSIHRQWSYCRISWSSQLWCETPDICYKLMHIRHVHLCGLPGSTFSCQRIVL